MKKKSKIERQTAQGNKCQEKKIKKQELSPLFLNSHAIFMRMDQNHQMVVQKIKACI
jgi:hypothetical protein